MALGLDELAALTQNEVDPGYWIDVLEDDTDYRRMPVDQRFTVYDDVDHGVSVVHDAKMKKFGSTTYDPGDTDQRDTMLMHMISWVPWFAFENDEDVTAVAVYRAGTGHLFGLVDVLEEDDAFVQHRDYPRGYRNQDYELLLHQGYVSVAATEEGGSLGQVQDILEEEFTYEKFVLRDGDSWLSKEP